MSVTDTVNPFLKTSAFELTTFFVTNFRFVFGLHSFSRIMCAFGVEITLFFSSEWFWSKFLLLLDTLGLGGNVGRNLLTRQCWSAIFKF